MLTTGALHLSTVQKIVNNYSPSLSARFRLVKSCKRYLVFVPSLGIKESMLLRCYNSSSPFQKVLPEILSRDGLTALISLRLSVNKHRCSGSQVITLHCRNIIHIDFQRIDTLALYKVRDTGVSGFAQSCPSLDLILHSMPNIAVIQWCACKCPRANLR